MQKFKVGIIGMGFMGQKHAKTLLNHPNFELFAVCDLDPEKLSHYTCNTTQYPAELCELPLDIVVVATPNYLHHEHALLALKSGKNVICEKPLAIHQEKALLMIQTAQYHQKHLFCMLQNRLNPLMIWLKKIIQQNLLGSIYLVQVNCFWNRDHRYYQNSSWKGTLLKDGGPLFTQFSHFTDILFALWGGPFKKIHHVSFFNKKHIPYIEFEDTGSLLFSIQPDVLVQFNYTIACFEKNLESSITIIGEKGSIQIGGQYMNELKVCELKDPLPEPAPTLSIPPNHYPTGYQGSASNHEAVFQNIFKVLAFNNEPFASIIEALYSVQLIEEIYKFRM